VSSLFGCGQAVWLRLTGAPKGYGRVGPPNGCDPARRERVQAFREAIASFDERADKYFEAHLRGRPVADRVMYAASAAGDHGLIWAVLAGVEGALSPEGPSLRPLARASAALVTESIVVNGLVKLGFRRQRPERSDPPPLPLRVPITSSFPSGHASSAFFAAALLRRGSTLWLYYPLAVVVASSRVHVRIHYASDVVGGALLGAALGELARRAFPVWGSGQRGMEQ